MISKDVMNGGTVVDRVHRFPENGIKVVIIGGGVGGLAAALECWRKGCDVVVLEQAEKLSPLGDFFTIPPSGLTTLKEYPSMYEEYHKCVYDCTTHVYTPSGVAIKSTVPEWKRPGASHSAPDVNISFLSRRPVWAKRQLSQLERLGIPIRFGEKVVSVREETDCIVITTATGESITGDICIGANGIGSKIDGFNTGPDVAVQDSGYAVARVAFPRDVIKKGSPAARLLRDVEHHPQFRTYVSEDSHVILFLTKDYVAWCFTHSDDHAKESWYNLQGADAFITELERTNSSWDPAVIDFLRQTPVDVVDWKLRWRDGTRQWTSDGGRLLRLGDAAHAFFPTAGNGAVQAIEDAVSIGECLRLGGRKNAHVATKVHNALRFERVSILQQTGFLNREELHTADIEAIEKKPEEANIGFFRIGRWVWAHDPEEYARHNYDACLASLESGKPFANTNVPPGHVYKAWSLESEKKRMAAGVRSDLKQNGYWGI